MYDRGGFPANVGKEWRSDGWLFLTNFGTVLGMESNDRAAYKRWHAERLRKAIGGDPERRQIVMTATGRSYRTVGNWISEKKPTMPSDAEREAIRKVLKVDYDREGDAVERAVFGSDLTEDRAHDVVGYYKKRLREQRESGSNREDVS